MSWLIMVISICFSLYQVITFIYFQKQIKIFAIYFSLVLLATSALLLNNKSRGILRKQQNYEINYI